MHASETTPLIVESEEIKDIMVAREMRLSDDESAVVAIDVIGARGLYAGHDDVEGFWLVS
jgi:hypothetical protein